MSSYFPLRGKGNNRTANLFKQAKFQPLNSDFEKKASNMFGTDVMPTAHRGGKIMKAYILLFHLCTYSAVKNVVPGTMKKFLTTMCESLLETRS